MREELAAITRGFEDLKALRTTVVETVDSVEQRVGALRKAHETLVATSPASACALGLDSLHFQVRLVSMELASLREMVAAVENHLYYECMYLHKAIQDYASADIADAAAKERILVDREYPPYKHLDGNAHYDFDVTVGLHAQLVGSVQAMADYSDERAAEIENEKGRSKQGLNIDSLVHSNAYVHALVMAKVELFSNSLAAFNGHHGKYLRRIRDKAQLVLRAITKDVRIEVGADKTAVPASSGSDSEGTPRLEDVSPTPRLTDAQRERKKRKQKKLKQKQRERSQAVREQSRTDAEPAPEASQEDAEGEDAQLSSSPAAVTDKTHTEA